MGVEGQVIRAIETQYKGYKFRSRLEARWAVFFDAVGFHWQYEPQGFSNGKLAYLPDFFVNELDMWLEVKPGTPTPQERVPNDDGLVWRVLALIVAPALRQPGN